MIAAEATVGVLPILAALGIGVGVYGWQEHGSAIRATFAELRIRRLNRRAIWRGEPRLGRSGDVYRVIDELAERDRRAGS